MPGAHCAVFGCTNGKRGLDKWKKTKGMCTVHETTDHGYSMSREDEEGTCVCVPPYVLYTFPTAKKDMEGRQRWIRLIRRKNEATGAPWEPTSNSRVCSEHFIDGEPTTQYPDPSLKMGYTSITLLGKRKLPKDRTSTMTEAKLCRIETAPKEEDPLEDHTYRLLNEEAHTSEKSEQTQCEKCANRQSEVDNLTKEISKLKLANSTPTASKSKCEKFICTDEKVKANTGLPSCAALEALTTFLSKRAGHMRYWAGARKKIISTKVARKIKSTPTKPGPKRKLSIKEELVIVLMRLRLNVTNEFLGCIFGMSRAFISRLLCSWVKFLAVQLKNLVFWPDKVIVAKMLPASFSSEYANLRCTIDCAETFIERPRDLLLQSATWSDYKHHNTLKYLVAIAPNGHISFISGGWGGRTSDRHIVQNSGFLDLIDPFDLVMADRGFPIQEDLLFKHASLLIPPPTSGKTQMCIANSKKTRRVANARIHVERAINRLKWFNILSSTMPISMLHLFDDILLICAALCNLLPPLVY